MTTPARRQYLRMKSQYPDAILMYQVGDFYETFDEDARIAARELQIVYTSRRYGEEQVPLAGIPLHALENYVGKLVQRGYKVAICDQVGEVGKGANFLRTMRPARASAAAIARYSRVIHRNRLSTATSATP